MNPDDWDETNENAKTLVINMTKIIAMFAHEQNVDREMQEGIKLQITCNVLANFLLTSATTKDFQEHNLQYCCDFIRDLLENGVVHNIILKEKKDDLS